MPTAAEIYDLFGRVWNEGYEPMLGAMQAVRAAIDAAPMPLTRGALAAVREATGAFNRATGRALGLGDLLIATLARVNENSAPDAIGAAREVAPTFRQWSDRALAEYDALLELVEGFIVRAEAHVPPPGLLDDLRALADSMRQAFERLGDTAPFVLPVGAVAALGAVILAGLWWFRIRPAAR